MGDAIMKTTARGLPFKYESSAMVTVDESVIYSNVEFTGAFALINKGDKFYKVILNVREFTFEAWQYGENTPVMAFPIRIEWGL